MASTRDELVDRMGANPPPDSEKPKVDKRALRAAGENSPPRRRPGSGTSTTIIAASPASTLSRASVEAAAMASTRDQPTDEAELAELRQANARHAADNRRRLAEIERWLTALEDR
jgi:hypothetical protein